MTNPLAAGPERAPYWQDRPCPSWCVGLHGDDDHYTDRHHHAEWQAQVTLSLETETDDEAVLRGQRGYAFTPPHLQVDLVQHYRENEPRLWLGWRGTNQGWHLTPAESRQLGEALIKGADLGEVGEGGG